MWSGRRGGPCFRGRRNTLDMCAEKSASDLECESAQRAEAVLSESAACGLLGHLSFCVQTTPDLLTHFKAVPGLTFLAFVVLRSRLTKSILPKLGMWGCPVLYFWPPVNTLISAHNEKASLDIRSNIWSSSKELKVPEGPLLPPSAAYGKPPPIDGSGKPEHLTVPGLKKGVGWPLQLACCPTSGQYYWGIGFDSPLSASQIPVCRFPTLFAL